MDSIKSLFRRSHEQEEDLIRTAQEKMAQQPTADTGLPTTNTEDEIKVIIDGFLGYIRALEQKVQEEVENAIQETERGNEIKTRLERSRKELDKEKADFIDEKYKEQSGMEKEKSQSHLKELFEHHKAYLTEEFDRRVAAAYDTFRKENEELQSRIASYATKIQSDEVQIVELKYQLAICAKELELERNSDVFVRLRSETSSLKRRIKLNDAVIGGLHSRANDDKIKIERLQFQLTSSSTSSSSFAFTKI
ncbi:MAG: hypothetical protein Q9171_001769 [Xanthocarpia ochracea]